MRKDIKGKTFGSLYVKSIAYIKNGHTHWNCTCLNCGKNCIRNITDIVNRENPMCQQCTRDVKRDDKKPNVIKKTKNYAIINNKVYVDKEDLPKILKFHRHVCVGKRGYSYIIYKGKYFFLHRLIMDLPREYDEKTTLIVDHKNGNTLDNRKKNLRVCKKEMNPINCKTYKNNTSGCKGVCWRKERRKWYAYLTYKKKRIHLGLYDNIENAIKARKSAEKKYYGEYARKE